MSSTKTSSPTRRRRRPVLTWIAGSLAGLLILGGVGLSVATTAFPDETTQAYGQVQQAVGKVRVEALHEIPIAKLGASGDKTLLGRCDGTFSQMLTYSTVGVPPAWAAHNHCGGDIVLPLALGDKVDIVKAGTTTRYVVVDIRETPKVWVTTKRLVGLKGDLALQSCFYGGTDVPMKFVGLVKDTGASAPAPAIG